MWYIGIDLHRETVVFAAVNDAGEVRPPVRLPCSEVTRIVAAFEQLRPFRAVVEATRAYRWLYQALSPLGTILLAHPLRLRAMVQRRSKTDRLDAQLLAQLLRINQIPLAYIPSEEFQLLRDITRQRAPADAAGDPDEESAALAVGSAQPQGPLRLPVRPAWIVLVWSPGFWRGRQFDP